MSFIVAIDGPAGSGKGTVTEIISKKFGLANIGTGSAYRCVALETIRKNIGLNEIDKIIKLLEDINVEFKIENGEDVIYLNGENVSGKLRDKDVTTRVSQISRIKEVRIKLNDVFRKSAINQDVIMEGRDIGTCVFPNADIKIYLDASVAERAKRRLKQNEELGIDMSYEEVAANIKNRDKMDMEREFGALKRAEDAVYIDSSNMSIEEVALEISKIIQEKRG